MEGVVSGYCSLDIDNRNSKLHHSRKVNMTSKLLPFNIFALFNSWHLKEIQVTKISKYSNVVPTAKDEAVGVGVKLKRKPKQHWEYFMKLLIIHTLFIKKKTIHVVLSWLICISYIISIVLWYNELIKRFYIYAQFLYRKASVTIA